jgi:isoleucyl-tRNA synthetase
VTAVRSDPRFRLLPPDGGANALEEELLARWRDEQLFARTLEAHADAPSWVFFEGPPTANGKPGIHHVFARTIKDLFCRHRAMKGFRVLRKAGWDTHGLPVEIEVEKQLPALLKQRGLSYEEISRASGKQLIEAFGVEEFNRLCRESVWKYQGDWERLSERIGYWLDYDNAYITYTNDYVESVWWALATLHEKGYLTRGHKILPYCPRCGTTLSSHEVALGYQDVSDPSVYVAVDLLRESGMGNREWERGMETRESGSQLALAVLTEFPIPDSRFPIPHSPFPTPASHSGLDDNPLDPRLQRRSRRAPRARLRRAREEDRHGLDDHSRRGARGGGAWRGLSGSVGHRGAVSGLRARRRAI